MAGERTHPILSCPDLDEAIDFYQALGFRQSYRQVRPNPYAVLAREDMVIHLAGIDDFDPKTSVSSVIVVVPDAELLYASFADGLRQRFGRLPSAGIPRILRIRRKQGTATGFSVVDVGGNWLRFYRDGEVESDDPLSRRKGLARVLEAAARQGDARGDDATALGLIERGLAHHPDAPAVDRMQALLYRAELLVRIGQPESAAATLVDAAQLELTDMEARAVAAELKYAREIVRAAVRGNRYD